MGRHGDGLFERKPGMWYLNRRWEKERYQILLGTHISRAVAVELAAVKWAAFLRGEAGIGRHAKGPDCGFDAAKATYLEWVEANRRPRTFRGYRECLAHLTDSFATTPLRKITTWNIEKHKQRRDASGARVRANREVSVLKSLFNFAIKMELYRGTNPAVGVKLFPEPQQRLRYLDHEEEARLLAQASDPLHSVILLGINTGLRIGAEALTLQWDHIDFARGLLTVEAAYAKNGQQRTVPMNSVTTHVLTQLAETRRGAWVFGRRDGTPFLSMRKGFDMACTKAGLHDVTLHTLRHTFASRLAMRGVDLRAIQELGGWKTLELVQRYAHLSAGHLVEAVERIAADNLTTKSPIAPWGRSMRSA